jgi:hypothetical protein
MSSKIQLAKVTGDDLSETPSPVNDNMPNYREVLPPGPVSHGTVTPKLSEAVTALLIMNGCQAQWVINYWRITRRVEPGQAPIGVKMRPGEKWRIETGASANAPFSEWQSTLKSFVREAVGTEN